MANADEMVAPSWLDKDFFEMVLRKYHKDDVIVIKKFEVTPGSAMGDHFASVIFRGVAEYTSSYKGLHKQSMIIKTIPEAEGFKKEFLDNLTVFETEIKMYAETLPKFEAVFRNYGEDIQFGPKILYHSLKPHKVIVLEDLTALGYSCIRNRLPNEDEVKGCLSRIAKWHAVSYKLASEGDQSIVKYKDGILSKPWEELPEFISGGLPKLIEALSKTEGMEIYVEKFKAMQPDFLKKCHDIFHAHDNGIKGMMVLNHGDFHMKNVMFKNDANDKMEDLMLIDFQMCCYAPAAIDLSYALFMMLTEDVRRHRREEFIYYYFSTFLEALRKIEFAGELPALADFYIDMYRFKEYELWVMSTFLPMIHALPTEDGKTDHIVVEEVITSMDALSLMYAHPEFIRELKWLLPKYLYSGYLS